MNKIALIEVPKTPEELAGRRIKPRSVSILDRVETVFCTLITDEQFNRLIQPLFREQTVEGDFAMDESELCRMIRNEASRSGDATLAKEKLAAIRHALNVVLRRYNMSRKARLEAYYAKRSGGVVGQSSEDKAKGFPPEIYADTE